MMEKQEKEYFLDEDVEMYPGDEEEEDPLKPLADVVHVQKSHNEGRRTGMTRRNFAGICCVILPIFVVVIVYRAPNEATTNTNDNIDSDIQKPGAWGVGDGYSTWKPTGSPVPESHSSSCDTDMLKEKGLTMTGSFQLSIAGIPADINLLLLEATMKDVYNAKAAAECDHHTHNSGYEDTFQRIADSMKIENLQADPRYYYDDDDDYIPQMEMNVTAELHCNGCSIEEPLFYNPEQEVYHDLFVSFLEELGITWNRLLTPDSSVLDQYTKTFGPLFLATTRTSDIINTDHPSRNYKHYSADIFQGAIYNAEGEVVYVAG